MPAVRDLLVLAEVNPTSGSPAAPPTRGSAGWSSKSPRRRSPDGLLAVRGEPLDPVATTGAGDNAGNADDGEPATPTADLCGDVVLLHHAGEQSVVQTRSGTSVLLLPRAGLHEGVRDLPDQAPAPRAVALPDALRTHTVFLGDGWTIGLADEAALNCRQAAGAWTES